MIASCCRVMGIASAAMWLVIVAIAADLRLVVIAADLRLVVIAADLRLVVQHEQCCDGVARQKARAKLRNPSRPCSLCKASQASPEGCLDW